MDLNRPWFAHYPLEVEPSLSYPNVSVTHFLQEAAEQFPHHLAIRFLGKSISYKQLFELSRRFAAVLQQLGMSQGDRVALMLPNCPQSVFCYYGSLLAGAVVVQCNPLYTERELLHQLSDSGAKLIVCLDLVYPRIQQVRGQTGIRQVIVTSLSDYLPLVKKLIYPIVQSRHGLTIDDGLPLKGLMRRSSPVRELPTIDPQQDLALLQYTGGTTGLAKGVMLTHANLAANVIQCKSWFHRAQQGKERFLAAIPFFHVYGMTVAMNLSIRCAGCLIIVPKFDVQALLKTIQHEKPTTFPGAPTMYIGLLNHSKVTDYDMSSINACISGSAPLPLEVQQQFENLTHGRLVEGYGLTECSPVTHTNPIWGRRKNGSIGLPWPDTDAKIVDMDTGEALPPEQIGELLVKGPQVMKGYWNRTEETQAVLKEGWLSTGDIAYMDEEGYFFIVDRKKDLIIASGFNVYPREVEEVLFEHPAILEAAVAGVTDPYRGETVKAFLVLKKGMDVSEQELDSFCRERLAAYKVPKIYEFRDELPKTLVGKVLRRALIESKQG